MVKAVADTQGENQGGFAYDTTHVTGFSHTHDSGTGGVSHHGMSTALTLIVCFDGQLSDLRTSRLSGQQPSEMRLDIVGQSYSLETRFSKSPAWLF